MVHRRDPAPRTTAAGRARAARRPRLLGEAHAAEPTAAEQELLARYVECMQDGVVTEIVTFDGAVFEHFDLPATLSAADGER